MTELGRRAGILAGTLVLILCIVVGIVSGSDILLSTVYAVLGGLLFGGAGYLIGNMFEGYVNKAFKREITRQVIEKDMARAAREAEREKKEMQETEEEEGLETSNA